MSTNFWFALSYAAICSFATLFVVAGGDNSTRLPEEKTPVREIEVTVQRPSQSGPVQMVRYVLFDAGIYPRELTVDKGLVNIALEDKTHSATTLVIDRIVGDERFQVGQIRRTMDERRGRGIVKLSPGRYEVYDASRPVNRAFLTVNP
jgi:hypothetical protein